MIGIDAILKNAALKIADAFAGNRAGRSLATINRVTIVADRIDGLRLRVNNRPLEDHLAATIAVSRTADASAHEIASLAVAIRKQSARIHAAWAAFDAPVDALRMQMRMTAYAGDNGLFYRPDDIGADFLDEPNAFENACCRDLKSAIKKHIAAATAIAEHLGAPTTASGRRPQLRRYAILPTPSLDGHATQDPVRLLATSPQEALMIHALRHISLDALIAAANGEAGIPTRLRHLQVAETIEAEDANPFRRALADTL